MFDRAETSGGHTGKPHVFLNAMKIQRKPSEPRTLWLLLGAALLLRLVLALVTEGYPYDMSCFVAWGDKLAAEGPAAFYSEGYFADYPPGYLFVLGLVGLLRAAFSIGYESPLTYLLLALVPSLCDCAAAWLVWRMAQHIIPGSRGAWALTAFTAFNPLMLFDTGIWKQIDGAFTLPLLFCFLLLERRRYLPAALLYGVALAIKPQALLFGPVLAACFLAAIAQEENRFRAFGRCFGGAAVALAPPLLAGIPFYGLKDLVPSLIEKYFGTVSGYPYASINAFNWLTALGGNWKSLEDTAMFGISWHTLGWFMILLVTGGLAFFAVRSVRGGHFSPLLLAAYYGLGVFTFGHCMHERYMVPGVLLTLLAAARWNDIRLYAAGFGLSLTGFINLATVYSLAGTEDEWLTSATSSTVAVLVGLAETVCFVMLLFAVWDIALHGHALPLPARSREENPAPAPQPAWQRRELLAMLGVTVATAVLSFAYLGDTTAPQNPLDATGTVLQETVTVEGDAIDLWVYPGISFGGSLQITDEQGNTLYTQELGYSTCFSWSESRLPVSSGQTLTVTVQNAQVFEMAFRDGDGNLLPVTGGGALFDEQGMVPDAISQLNSMYFDEIYHGRTAYEQLHKMPVYETTHPPLGKDLIMVGVALFGMTGFGWRFSGTLFGVLLVPLAWCFARRLTRKRWIGAVAGVLLALDFMRFAQSRIATIDIYGTFFILLGAYFMLWYCQSVLEKGVNGSLLPMALGGVAFGLGCAAKWTGIYAGAGLAILYLGVLYARWRQKQPGFWQEFRTAAWGGVLFYVLLPLCIYIASYLPYWWRDSSFSLADWWQCQVSMYSYHSNLEATHPFESRWYTWLLGLRPVWYYQNIHLAEGMKASIAGLGGPVIWLAGLGCLLALLWHQVSNRGSRAGAGVLILYGTQLIPWMLVPRCTFLYHYFPSSMFCLAAIALVLSHIRNTRKAQRIGKGLCILSLALFICYYPVLSGLPIPDWWAQALEILPSFGFY